MSNPLFQSLGGAANDGGFGQFVNEFYRFRDNFKGDAKAEVQRLLNSGQMSQAQFNQLSQMANQMMRFLPHK